MIVIICMASEPDQWWFTPLLYAGAALVIAVLVLA